jgi:hypothetical protein
MATTPPAGRPRGQQQPPYVRPPTLILTAVVLALLVVGGAAAVVDQRPTSAPVTPSPQEPPGFDAAVGDCIRVNNADAADIAVVDCADRAAVYRVAVRRDTSTQPCPGASYVTYSLGDSLRLCFVLNAHQGECFDAQDGRVDCAAANASFRVEQVIAGSADPSRCGEPNAANAIVYPQPKLTLCRVPLN